jgi:hypothetical protein
MRVTRPWRIAGQHIDDSVTVDAGVGTFMVVPREVERHVARNV